MTVNTQQLVNSRSESVLKTEAKVGVSDETLDSLLVIESENQGVLSGRNSALGLKQSFSFPSTYSKTLFSSFWLCRWFSLHWRR